MSQMGKDTGIGTERRALRLASVLAGALLLGACAQGGVGPAADLLASGPKADQVADAGAATSKTDLEQATEYWGKAYAKTPRDLTAALSYAKNLKAMGQKGQALAVLQQASLFHSQDKKLNAEYGRLALELDQLSVARQLLEAADDPTSPDWRVISARGTVLAKQGQYKDAIPFYERALTLANEQPSIMSNLALAYTMNGEAEKAEPLLRRAAELGADNKKVRQNLALVLGLQGKYEESKRIGGEVMPADSAAANTDLLRKMVRLDAKKDIKPGQPAVFVPSDPAPVLKPATVEASAGSWDTATKVSAAPAAPTGPGFKGSTR